MGWGEWRICQSKPRPLPKNVVTHDKQSMPWEMAKKSKVMKILIALIANFHYSSVQFSCSVMSDSLWPHELQRARLRCPSLSPGVCSNSCPSSGWCHPATASSATPSPFAFRLSQHQVSNKSALCIRRPQSAIFIYCWLTAQRAGQQLMLIKLISHTFFLRRITHSLCVGHQAALQGYTWGHFI